MPVTLRFQSTGAVPGNARPVSMRGGSLTVGRAPDNDLVLPDPDKIISKRHCAIERQNGAVVVIDLSSNGTFLNYDKQPLGRTPKRLHDGDILIMGAYELVVEVNEDVPEDDLLPPAGEAPSRPRAEETGLGDVLDEPGGDFLDDLLGDGRPSGPKSVKRPELGEDGILPPLGEEEDPLAEREEPERGPTQSDHGAATQDYFNPRSSGGFIPEDWEEDLLGGSRAGREPAQTVEPGKKTPAQDLIPEDDDLDPLAPQGPTRPAVEPEEDWTETSEPPPPQPVARAAAAPPPAAGGTASPAGRNAARACLEALSEGQLDIPDDELEETMARLGGVMREMIVGLREVLMTRAQIKSEFRIQATMVGAAGNNPLKFSVSPEQAVEAIVRPRLPGYLQPAEAAREALNDVKAHEVATMSGMEAALKGVLGALAPEALEGQIRSKGGFGDLLKSRKALYWETYERIYGQVSDQAEKEFHELFGREFARAYQRQLEKLK